MASLYEKCKGISELEEYIKAIEAKNKTKKEKGDNALEEYLNSFDVVENKTRKSYSLLGCHMFCIKKAKNYTIGIPHRDEFAEHAKKCNAAHIGYSNGLFDGWVRFKNENDVVDFLKYVTDVRSREYKNYF